MNPQKLSHALDNQKNEIFLNLTTEKIHQMTMKIINELYLPKDIGLSWMKKLLEYRYVDEIKDLNYGSYIRWINIKDPSKMTISRGATIFDIKIFILSSF